MEPRLGKLIMTRWAKNGVDHTASGCPALGEPPLAAILIGGHAAVMPPRLLSSTSVSCHRWSTMSVISPCHLRHQALRPSYGFLSRHACPHLPCGVRAKSKSVIHHAVAAHPDHRTTAPPPPGVVGRRTAITAAFSRVTAQEVGSANLVRSKSPEPVRGEGSRRTPETKDISRP